MTLRYGTFSGVDGASVETFLKPVSSLQPVSSSPTPSVSVIRLPRGNEMIITKGDVSKVICFQMIKSVDHMTPATDITPTVTLSKNGGAFAAAKGTVAEILNGWYKLTPDADDVGTTGQLIIHATEASADPTSVCAEVVEADLHNAASLGLSRIDAAITSRSNHSAADVDAAVTATHGVGSYATAAGFAVPADITASTVAIQGDITALNDLSSGDIGTVLDAQGLTAIRAATLDNLDAKITTRSKPGDDQGLTVAGKATVESAVQDAVIESTMSLTEILSIIVSVCAGQSDVTAPGVVPKIVKFRDLSNAVDRVTAEMNGTKRVTMTFDLTPT